MSGRVWQGVGLAAVAGVGYYMYQAGGDPKTAQKKAEADATKLSNDVKSQLPGKAEEAKKDAQALGSSLGAKADAFARDAKSEVNRADAKLDQYRKDVEKSFDKTAKDAQSSVNAAVDKFDKSVTEGAGKAKSGISGWFGGEKK